MTLRVLFACIASLFFSVIFNVRGKNIYFAAVSGGISYFVYLVLLDYSSFFAVFSASCAISLYSEIVARLRKTPATLFLVAGMLPIVPGGGMYRCMLEALEGNLQQAAYICYNTILEAGAIAIGIITISSLNKMFFTLKKQFK